MIRTLRPTGLRPSPRSGRSRAWAGGRRPRLVRAGIGTVLVVATVVLVLGPVLALLGAAASLEPLLDVPAVAAAVAVVLGLLGSAAFLVLASATYRAWLGWTFVALAWLLAVLASLWPLVAAADATVDHARDVLPRVVHLVRESA